MMHVMAPWLHWAAHALPLDAGGGSLARYATSLTTAPVEASALTLSAAPLLCLAFSEANQSRASSRIEKAATFAEA